MWIGPCPASPPTSATATWRASAHWRRPLLRAAYAPHGPGHPQPRPCLLRDEQPWPGIPLPPPRGELLGRHPCARGGAHERGVHGLRVSRGRRGRLGGAPRHGHRPRGGRSARCGSRSGVRPLRRRSRRLLRCSLAHARAFWRQASDDVSSSPLPDRRTVHLHPRGLGRRRWGPTRTQRRGRSRDLRPRLDGDLTDKLVAAGAALPHPSWACFHTTMFSWEAEFGVPCGVIARTIGGPDAVVVAEQLFVSGARVVLGLKSAGRVAPGLPLPHVVVIDEAIRDEGTSYHTSRRRVRSAGFGRSSTCSSKASATSCCR